MTTVELSENILQNLGNDLMAERVDHQAFVPCVFIGSEARLGFTVVSTTPLLKY